MSDKVVKSVGRVFEILELFDRERRPLGAIDIARALGYPHTSTLSILKSMQTLGYLSHERDTWSFLPTQSLPQLVQWISNSLQHETDILSIMSTLHALTGETINLSRQVGEHMKIVYGLESTKTVGVNVRQGTVMPLNASHTGMVALATMADADVARLVRKIQSAGYEDSRNLSVEQALEETKLIRQQRYAPGYDLYIGGIGAICFPVQSAVGDGYFVIGVVGPSERIREAEIDIIETSKKAVENSPLELAYPNESQDG